MSVGRNSSVTCAGANTQLDVTDEAIAKATTQAALAIVVLMQDGDKRSVTRLAIGRRTFIRDRRRGVFAVVILFANNGVRCTK